jgi:hypothetical protein
MADAFDEIRKAQKQMENMIPRSTFEEVAETYRRIFELYDVSGFKKRYEESIGQFLDASKLIGDYYSTLPIKEVGVIASHILAKSTTVGAMSENLINSIQIPDFSKLAVLKQYDDAFSSLIKTFNTNILDNLTSYIPPNIDEIEDVDDQEVHKPDIMSAAVKLHVIVTVINTSIEAADEETKKTWKETLAPLLNMIYALLLAWSFSTTTIQDTAIGKTIGSLVNIIKDTDVEGERIPHDEDTIEEKSPSLDDQIKSNDKSSESV